MNAVERLRRVEQREDVRFWARHFWPFLFGAVCFVGGYFLGVRHGSPSQDSQQTVHALEDNADSLRAVRTSADSIKHVDSVASAVVAAERPRTAAAIAGISVQGDTITVKRPAAASDKPAPEGSALVLPDTTVRTIIDPVLAGAFAQMKVQLVADSTSLAEKDVRIVLLSRQVDLLTTRDSLHVGLEKQLERERDGAFRRGVIRGVTGTVKVAAVIIVAVKVIAVARR